MTSDHRQDGFHILYTLCKWQLFMLFKIKIDCDNYQYDNIMVVRITHGNHALNWNCLIIESMTITASQFPVVQKPR